VKDGRNNVKVTMTAIMMAADGIFLMTVFCEHHQLTVFSSCKQVRTRRPLGMFAAPLQEKEIIK
jgi:hypothetical protein